MFIFCRKYFAITKYDIRPFYFFSGKNKEIQYVYRSYILLSDLDFDDYDVDFYVDNNYEYIDTKQVL